MLSDLANDPDYTLVWPPEILRGEIERMVRRASEYGVDPAWRHQVDTLLRQAFSSAVPSQDFERAKTSGGYSFDDEPF